jgi:mono/diheme cytochrome c family protein
MMATRRTGLARQFGRILPGSSRLSMELISRPSRRTTQRLVALLTLLVLGSLMVIERTRAVGSTSTLSRDAYVILEKNCFSCHGVAQTSELDLRTGEGILKGGTNGKVVVPGNPAASRLILFVTHQEKPVMPPSGRLSEADIDTLRRWVAAGAPFDGPSRMRSDATGPFSHRVASTRLGLPIRAGAGIRSIDFSMRQWPPRGSSPPLPPIAGRSSVA